MSGLLLSLSYLIAIMSVSFAITACIKIYMNNKQKKQFDK